MPQPDKPTSSPTTPVDPRVEQLLEQARSAAEQAIEFARLAQEQAKLARDLNAQARVMSGGALQLPADELRQIQKHVGSSGVVSANALISPEAQLQSPADAPPLSAPADSSFALPPGMAGLDDASQPAAAATIAPPVSRPRGRSGKKNKNHVRQKLEQQRRRQQPLEKLSRKDVRVKVRKKDLKPQIRDEDLTTFVGTNWRYLVSSGALLLLAIVALGLIFFEIKSEKLLNTVMASFGDIEAVVEEDTPTEIPLEEDGEQQEEETDEPEPEEEEEVVEMEEPDPAPTEPEMVEQPEPEPVVAETTPVESDVAATTADVSAETVSVVATEGSRSESARAALLKKYGGTAASESAVQRALDWFARHQMQNGAWNFPVIGQCSSPGDTDNAMGATSYVLLSYLGAGQTHRKGKYKRQVTAGLNFLMANARSIPEGADFRGPNCEEDHNFYVQGAAAMVLCEAFAMTKDRKLRPAAQAAIRLICAAQDPRGGGWRYEPREPGSTSVTGLQIMALKSAKMAGLQVPPIVAKRAEFYLDSVRSDGTSGRYGYTAEKPTFKSSTTAIALLGRIYLGWDRSQQELANGVTLLSDRGPQKNFYHNYYATQVLHQWGGDEWPRWNEEMREKLVREQIVADDDPENGSWSPWDRGISSVAGGRLFATCLATMTLEVYYRYLPIYDEFGKQVAEQSGKSKKPKGRRSGDRENKSKQEADAKPAVTEDAEDTDSTSDK